MLKLREIREDKGFMQKTLAEKLNRTQTCISDWERGRTEPGTTDLCALADILQVTVDELLGREDYATGNVVVQGVALSVDEQQLIEIYRTLSMRYKAELIGFAKGLAY